MKITIEPDLSTSIDSFFAYPFKTFKNQLVPTEILKIPLQQREYKWGTSDGKENNIECLLEDLDHHINISNDKYFAGTILLENQNDNYLKIIDGQQRITTIFLLNYLGFLLSRHRLQYMPTIPNPVFFTIDFASRFDLFLKFESQIFINTYTKQVKDLINHTGGTESNQQLLKRIGFYSDENFNYWDNNKLRLEFDDLEINANFIKTILNTKIANNADTISIIPNDGTYESALTIILNYFGNTIIKGSKDLDSYIKEILEKIENYLKNCGLAAIISEDSDDSFRLFEILNDRGQDLSALDLIKNIILEECNIKKITIPNFSKDWKSLKSNVKKSFAKGKADSIFVENIIKSEGSTIKNKEISYLKNKLRGPNIESRNQIFIDEKINDFFTRLHFSSKILKEINENLKIDASKYSSVYSRSPMSCFQYTTFMKLINYHWGPQIILCSNIQYLLSSNYEESINLGSSPDWKNSSSSSKNVDLNHFTRFLGDITLKLGIIGTVNGLSTNLLPTKSKEISKLIIENVANNPTDFNSLKNLTRLKDNIIAELNKSIFTNENKNLFNTRMSETFIVNSSPKKNIVKIILYFIYNQGRQTHSMVFPELEHLEPMNKTPGASPYYDGSDRQELINRLGNFALIEKTINIVDFSNKPLIEKIRLATVDPKLTKIALFKNDIFLNLNFDIPLTHSSIYGDMPLIKKANKAIYLHDDSFDISGSPLPYFFNIRSKFLSNLATEILFSNNFFDGTSY